MKFFAVTIALLATVAIASPIADVDNSADVLVKRDCTKCSKGKQYCCFSSGDVGSLCNYYSCRS
jgi:hypothetical protein